MAAFAQQCPGSDTWGLFNLPWIPSLILSITFWSLFSSWTLGLVGSRNVVLGPDVTLPRPWHIHAGHSGHSGFWPGFLASDFCSYASWHAPCPMVPAMILCHDIVSTGSSWLSDEAPGPVPLACAMLGLTQRTASLARFLEDAQEFLTNPPSSRPAWKDRLIRTDRKKNIL